MLWFRLLSQGCARGRDRRPKHSLLRRHCCEPPAGASMIGHKMTLLELGQIASKYDTLIAHALLHAVAVAMAGRQSSEARR